MIKENVVSLWLGNFKSSEEFTEYVDVRYDEDGNYIKSPFQEEFCIAKYDFETTEKDWISERCTDVRSLLAGFSCDEEIIPKFEKIINKDKLIEYNSILLLYNFEGETANISSRMDYIGCVDFNINQFGM